MEADALHAAGYWQKLIFDRRKLGDGKTDDRGAAASFCNDSRMGCGRGGKGSQTVTQGEVTVYGTSVAHSKGIYHAFALTLSSSGEALTLDVRNYTERKDYGIEIRQAADGTVYVYSGSYENAAPLLAPFAGLQAVTDHGLEVAQ